MSTDKAWIFFYGTFMSANVLRDHGVDCEATYPARLGGFALTIRPRVNLVVDAESFAYGGLALIRQSDISALYDGLWERFGIAYRPVAVSAEMPDGWARPALCFLTDAMAEAPADPHYVTQLVHCATEMGAPGVYLRRIESFLSAT